MLWGHSINRRQLSFINWLHYQLVYDEMNEFNMKSLLMQYLIHFQRLKKGKYKQVWLARCTYL
jgi:hypothetical protein